jgi:hypothetical protein
MKYLTISLISLMTWTLAFAEVQQDIVFKSRFDLNSSEFFINQLRIFLANNNFGDPYSQELKKPIVVDLAEAIDEIPQDTQIWIKDLQSVLKLQLFESSYKLNVEKFGYTIKDFNSELKPGKSVEQRVEYVTISYVRGLHLHASKISFEVELKQTQSREPLKFKIEVIEPEFIVSPDLTAEISMGWATSILPENISLSLESVDISKIMEKIVSRPDLIDLKIKDILIPEVSVKVGSKVVKFDRLKIKKFFEVRRLEMKLGLLDILNVNMKERFSNILKDNPKNLMLPKVLSFKGDISGVLDVQKMTVNKTEIVQFDFDGYFCDTNSLSLVDDFCKNQVIKPKERRVIQLSQYQKSLREINRSLIEEKANIAVSVSENYLNQLVEGTIKAGMWADALKENDFTLGPEKAFILAEQNGEKFSLYLDIIYKLKGAQRILVGRNELRFPIKLMIALNVEEIGDIPHFTIKVKEIATNYKLLVEGAPQYGLPTTVNSVRFRNKVVDTIISKVKELDQETLIDIELKELKGTYLDELEFFSDGLGRGTATIGFKKTRTKI